MLWVFTRDVHLCLTVEGIVALTLQKRDNTCSDETDRDPVADNFNEYGSHGWNCFIRKRTDQSHK